MAHLIPTTINSTIDQAILKEFFASMFAVKDICGSDSFPQERVEKWHRILRSIPEFKVNEEGAVKEWQQGNGVP